MKHVDILEVVTKIGTLVWPENPQGQTENGPKMDHLVVTSEMMGQLVDLGMAVMATGDTVGAAARLDLLVLDLAIGQSLIPEPRLQEAATAAATVVVGFVGIHLHHIFFSDALFDGVAKLVGNGVTEALTHDLARILDGELDFEVFIPIRVGLEFALTDPLGVVFVDVLCFEVVGDVEFFQSGPDREGDVTSLGVEVGLAPQLIGHGRLLANEMFPVLVVGEEEAIIFCRPGLAAVSPVDTGQVQNLPQGYHLIRFGHRFTRVLVDKELSADLVDGGLHIGELRLCRTVLLKDVVDDELEILNRRAHGAAGIAVHGDIAGIADTLGSLIAGAGGANVEDQAGDIDFHRTDIDTALTHGTHPRPIRLHHLFIHAEYEHAQKLAGIHIL
jgi:hypothetical protein